MKIPKRPTSVPKTPLDKTPEPKRFLKLTAFAHVTDEVAAHKQLKGQPPRN